MEGVVMDDPTAKPATRVSPTIEPELAEFVEVGALVALTQGQGGGQSEDKRRAYNCV
ncbi:albusnodin family lasso peptide [Streptomyces sp. NPDC058417]|uniref:albusnodin family lasso peptide n=1 Tax=unclassified Streptomyces TaxID=2593676 RepID=UPI003649F414